MPIDSAGLEVLSSDECAALLGSAALGRVVFTDRALPAVQPVTFTLVEGDVVFRAAEGSKLATAAGSAIVAFEVDEYDADARTGWSVVVVGPARVVRDPLELAGLERLPLESWAPRAVDRFVRISPRLVSGRRIPGARPRASRRPQDSGAPSSGGVV
ncbi:pyridoxamine 5'-phosphate oxidase family protein [Spirillospora sp. NPDC047279]|uniref:pyridoxamine 5'-phosphate oxidase family protein n=1 Tax=Spirillospora sp. NPDC047279 TaxID=3155478 RepID=UPI0033F46240